MRRRTIVSFHAHPDDEALLTGGSLARAAADGHRVVLVVATDGEAGLASSALGPDLRDVRRRELEASARALGCARLVRLCFADSGWHDSRRAGLDVFSRLDVATAAAPLVEILREERADVLTIYDRKTEGPQCQGCGYDLKGVESGRCPECGRVASGEAAAI